MNPDLGNNARLLASVEGIVNSLFTRRQESFSRIIEAKQVPVLREEFADGYVALFCRHRLGRDDAALWLFTCFVDHRHILCCVYQKPPPRRPESSLSIVATRFSTRWEHLTPNMGLRWTLKLTAMLVPN